MENMKEAMQPILVKVNDELTLVAGAVSESHDEQYIWYEITPPAKSMFDQLIEYLNSQPSLPYEGIRSARYGVGLTALCIRWGCYLAALLDNTATLHPDIPTGKRQHQPEEISFISDSEMKRLNIEISYNLSRLGMLYRENSNAYFNLLQAASTYLPMPFKNAKKNAELDKDIYIAYLESSLRLYMKDHPERIQDLVIQGILTESIDPSQITIETVDEQDAGRSIANILVNRVWRNTVVEDYHAGGKGTVSLLLHQRRFSYADERILIKELSGNMAALIWHIPTLFGSTDSFSGVPVHFAVHYPRSATALRNAGLFSFFGYPNDWSLTESSSVVCLYK